MAENISLIQECEAYLNGLGFVKEEPSNNDLPCFGKFSFHNEIKGQYQVSLQTHELGEEAFEIKNSIIVQIDRISPGDEDNIWEVLGITIVSLEQLKLLVERTRTWRFMHLPLNSHNKQRSIMKQGDVVMHKSKQIKMTIREIDGNKVEVDYFDSSNKHHRETYFDYELELL